MHLSSTGADVTLTMFCQMMIWVILLKELKKNKIKTNFISEKNRPTTNKNTFISDPYRLLKVDTLSNSPIEKRRLVYIK